MSFEKALSSLSGNGGDMIVPQLADQIIPFIRQKSYLRQFLQSFQMPTETYRFPKLTSGNSVYYVGEGSSSPESLMSTGTVELAAKKLMVALAISAELEEDENIVSSINHIKTVKTFNRFNYNKTYGSKIKLAA